MQIGNTEVIATWMDGPKPDIQCEEHEWPFLGRNDRGRRYTWWTWERDRNGHQTCEMTLDALHLVEEKLSEEQWLDYDYRLFTELPAPRDRVEQIKKRTHATAEQKIAALAAVLRPLVEEPHA